MKEPLDVWVSSGDGGYVVQETGGRVVRLSPSPDDVNNVFFEGLDTIAGGDRMWIAPETDLFYDGAVEEQNWRCPPDLDPGTWRMQRTDRSIELTQTALGTEMRREVTPLSEWEHAGSLRWSGYRMAGEIETERRWSAWQLVMLPAPADIRVRAPGDPIVYYPPAPAATGGVMRADGEPPRWKVGFEPPSDGRVALAALFDPDPGPLVVITTQLDPGGTYVDLPIDGSSAAAVQVFDSSGDGFCELELHGPLETRRIGSEIVAAWGSREERLRVVDELTRG